MPALDGRDGRSEIEIRQQNFEGRTSAFDASTSLTVGVDRTMMLPNGISNVTVRGPFGPMIYTPPPMHLST